MTRRLNIISYITSAIVIFSSNVSYAQTGFYYPSNSKHAIERQAPPCSLADYYLYCEFDVPPQGLSPYCLKCRKELFGY
jgi:hypothetical protein